MYEDYRSALGDERGYSRRSPPRHVNSRDGDYRRSRKDTQSYHNPPHDSSRTLDYDDHEDHYDDGRQQQQQQKQQHHDRRDGRSQSPYGSRDAGSRDDDGYRGDGWGGRGSYYNSRGDSRRYSGGRRDDSRPRQSYGPGPPSKSVLIEDVPDDATERDILYGLNYITRDPHMSSNQVRVARLRLDHNGCRIACVEFHRRSDAEQFMDKYYPEISFPLEHTRGIDSESIPFRISFNSHNRDGAAPPKGSRREDVDWDCTACGAVNFPHRAVCYKCRAERPDDGGYGRGYGPYSGPVLTGETDEDPQKMPSQYVVIRDLGPSVTEQVLASGVMKLFLDTNSDRSKEAPSTTNKLKSTAPTAGTAGLGAKPGSLRRVFLMRDRRSNDSWKYGFAEFATVEDAMGAVAKFRASTRFTIASRPAVVAFIHTGVFVPALDVDPNTNSNITFSPIYNRSLRLKYWDDRAYPSVWVVSKDPAADTQDPEKAGGKDGSTKATAKSTPAPKKKKDKDPGSSKTVFMMPQMQMWAKKSAELHGVKKSVDTQVESREEVPSAGALPEDRAEKDLDGPHRPFWTDKYLSYADWDRLACVLCDWEVPSQEQIDESGYSQYRRRDILIDHEVRVHNHYKDAEVKEKAAGKLSAIGKQPRSIVRRTPRLQSATPPIYVSYADFDALRCHLCRRSFEHAQTIWRHEQESELHKHMLTDAGNKERATAELKAKGKPLQTMVPDSMTEQQQSRYRDRALERRKLFRQPNKPKPAAKSGATAGGAPHRTAEKRKEPVAELEEAPAKKSKGAGMLAKMGWTVGGGLGAEGTGRTEAIATDAYVPGVGLGAEGGKLGDANEEAARKTRGDFADFVEKTKDRARERYERLG